ncbi:hypothetical protein TSAR_004532 [Trichomalopsis sarcophagae]|uniref:Uncharacterized protein n=1 Tax=Trichomalopsis sarcophagae TaxID=543379 RepID=A0A232EMD6_9HYME|nr:hypothetical protein TSAR_004532 [Trichomalopsis sarcophagae]
MAGRGKQWPRNYQNQSQQPFYVENDDDDYVDDGDYENEKVTLAGLLNELSDTDKDLDLLVEKKKAIVAKMKRIISPEKDHTSSHRKTPQPSSFSNGKRMNKHAVVPFTATSTAAGSNNYLNMQLPLQQSYAYNDEQRHRQMLSFEDQKLQNQKQPQQLNYYQQLEQQQLLMTMTMNNNVKLGMTSSVFSESNPSAFISSTRHPRELLQQQQQLQSENLMRYRKKRIQHHPSDQMDSTSSSNNLLSNNNEQDNTRPFDEKLPLQQSYAYNDEQRHRQMLSFEDQKLQNQKQPQQLNYYQQLEQQQLLMTMTMNNNVKLGMTSSVFFESNPSAFISSTQHPRELLQQQQLQSENLMRYRKKRIQHHPSDQRRRHDMSLQNDSFVNKYNYNFDDSEDDADNSDDNGHDAILSTSQQYDKESDENNDDANNTAQQNEDDAPRPHAQPTKKCNKISENVTKTFITM